MTIQNILRRNVASYVQGQSPKQKIREYFYYIDHQGMLFLDDARIKNFTSCFKEKAFLAFFFKRLKKNDTTRYTEDFPYLSPCGFERNYVRCDDLPIVFTEILKPEKSSDENFFSYNHAGNLLMIPFQPRKLFMSKSGRIYHPAHDTVGGIGLVKSSLAIEFSKYFNFEEGEDKKPTHFNWQGKIYDLDNEWYIGKQVKEDLGVT